MLNLRVRWRISYYLVQQKLGCIQLRGCHLSFTKHMIIKTI